MNPTLVEEKLMSKYSEETNDFVVYDFKIAHLLEHNSISYLSDVTSYGNQEEVENHSQFY